MTEPYTGEIQLFGFQFPPRNWAIAGGGLIAIRQNTALFSLLGVQYGGDGTVTFALPNFTATAPCNQGQGPGLTDRVVGETFGENTVTLTPLEMPTHNHVVSSYNTRSATTRVGTPAPGNWLASPTQAFAYADETIPPNTTFAPNNLVPTGSGLPHENRQPFLAVGFCIAMQGVFPSFG